MAHRIFLFSKASRGTQWRRQGQGWNRTTTLFPNPQDYISLQIRKGKCHFPRAGVKLYTLCIIWQKLLMIICTAENKKISLHHPGQKGKDSPFAPATFYKSLCVKLRTVSAELFLSVICTLLSGCYYAFLPLLLKYVISEELLLLLMGLALASGRPILEPAGIHFIGCRGNF